MTGLSGGRITRLVRHPIKSAGYEPFGYSGPRLGLSLDLRVVPGIAVLDRLNAGDCDLAVSALAMSLMGGATAILLPLVVAMVA